MIYRPVRERDPQGDRRRRVARGARRRLRRGFAHQPLDRRLQRHLAADPRRGRASSRRSASSLGVSSLRAYGLAEDVLDDIKDGAPRPHVRARGRHASACATWSTRTSPKSSCWRPPSACSRAAGRKMKLYFMIGLPTEEDEDVRGIVEIGERALDGRPRAQGARARASRCSVSTHVPKPHTPFQWCAMDARDEVLRKQAAAARRGAQRSGVELRMHDSTASCLEGVLARGDRTLGDVIERRVPSAARASTRWEEQLKLARLARGVRSRPASTRSASSAPSRSARGCPGTTSTSGSRRVSCHASTARRCKQPPEPAVRQGGRHVHPPHEPATTHEADTRKLVCYDCGVACDLTAMRDRAQRLSGQAAAHASRARRPSPRAKLGGAEAAPRRPRARRRATAQEAAASAPTKAKPVRVRLQLRQARARRVRLAPRPGATAAAPVPAAVAAACTTRWASTSKPVMVFGPALSLGVLSLAEYVDLKLALPASRRLAALPEMLSASAIDGVRFVRRPAAHRRRPQAQPRHRRGGLRRGLPRSSLERSDCEGKPSWPNV